jgi:L-malate glycosyltransferase
LFVIKNNYCNLFIEINILPVGRREGGIMEKKIMFLEARYNSFYGAQKSMLKLIQSLDTERFTFLVVTTGEGKLKERFEEEEIPVDVIKLGRRANVFGGAARKYSLFIKFIAMLQIVSFNLKIINYILRNKIDIVYINDFRAFLYSVLAAKLLRRKNVLYIRSEVQGDRIDEAILKFSSGIITIADGVLKRMPDKKVNKYRNKISNIYTGFEFDKFQVMDKKRAKEKLGISPEKTVVGFVGAISRRKGIDLLVDSFIEIQPRYRDAELLIVGDVSNGYEDYWAEQLQKIADHNLNFKHVPFHKNVSEAYSAMDIFVLASRDEGLPRVVIEAMGHELPVIATSAGGTKEIITSESVGIIVEETADSLTEGIKKLLDDLECREQISSRSREAVKMRFSDELFKEKINTYFSRI